MLKIPAPGDRPPPLVVPLKRPSEQELRLGAGPDAENKRRRKRKRKSRSGEGHAWDRSTGTTRGSGGEDGRQMFWMLIGGATLLVMIIAVVLVAMRGGDVPAPVFTKPAGRLPVPGAAEAGAPASSPAPRSDAAFCEEAEPLARKFLEAASIEEMLPLVRNPGVAEARMRRHYPDGKIEAPGMVAFNTKSEVSRRGALASVIVRTRDYEEKSLTFVETAEGIKIDWESWAAWSEMGWKEFLASKPTAGQVFRLSLSPVEYYNFEFADEKKWQSFRLESPGGEHSLYGYAERGSELSGKLRPPPDVKKIALMLSLKFPENATSPNQVIIEKIVAEGWVVETDAAP